MSPKIASRNAELLGKILALKADHPFWGYRRIWAHLRFIQGLMINKKRVLRLIRANGLLVTRNTRLRALRTSTRAKPRPMHPNEWWGIDMTKVMVEGFGWVYIVIVLDCVLLVLYFVLTFKASQRPDYQRERASASRITSIKLPPIHLFGFRLFK